MLEFLTNLDVLHYVEFIIGALLWIVSQTRGNKYRAMFDTVTRGTADGLRRIANDGLAVAKVLDAVSRRTLDDGLKTVVDKQLSANGTMLRIPDEHKPAVSTKRE